MFLILRLIFVSREIRCHALLLFVALSSFCSLNLYGTQQQGNPTVDEQHRLRAWLDLSFEYRFSHLDSAFFYAEHVLNEARAKGYKDFESDALRSLATNYQAQGDYDKALSIGFEALRTAKDLNDDIKIAHTQNLLGMIYDQQGNFPGALMQYREAYQTYKSKGQREWLAMIAVNLGILFKAQGAYEQVIPYYMEAYQIYKDLEIPAEAAFCETNLGSIYYYTQQFDSCVYYSLKAEKSLDAQGLTQIQPFAQTNAGLGFLGLGEWEKAKSYFEQALTFHRKSGSKKELSFLLIQLGKVYAQEANAERARAYLSEGKSLAEEIGSAPEVMESADLLAKHFAEHGDFRRAYEQLRHYSHVRDTLFNSKKLQTIANFQIQYDTEKKEQEIVRLNHETQIQRLQLRQRGILLLVTALVLTFVALFIYFLQNRRKLRAEARLQQEAVREVMAAEERERRRIAADLHDGVGQLLSAALMNLSQTRDCTEEHSEARRMLERSLDLVGESYDEMRSLSHQMMPNALLKAGLASSVKEFLNKIHGDTLKVSLDVVGLDERLDAQIETTLYRVIQEAVTNVVKHAEASRLSIQLLKDEDGVALTIEDNGKGFLIADPSHYEGLGLKNMNSRVNLLHGTLTVDSAPGRGTLVMVHIPGAKNY